jgi:hypothetical protein
VLHPYRVELGGRAGSVLLGGGEVAACLLELAVEARDLCVALRDGRVNALELARELLDPVVPIGRGGLDLPAECLELGVTLGVALGLVGGLVAVPAQLRREAARLAAAVLELVPGGLELCLGLGAAADDSLELGRELIAQLVLPGDGRLGGGDGAPRLLELPAQ